MSVPSTSELALLKTQPHQTKLWLSIYQPSTALAARVDDSEIARGEREIAYDTVSTGNYQLVEDDMIMLVGTTLGGDEKGRIRVRSITNSVITVAENSHIAWADNDYLTVLRYIELTAIFPRIIQDPNNDENVIFYKDYDIAYTNQNSILGTFVCMGPHHAAFLEPENARTLATPTGTFVVGPAAANVYYTASGTSNLLGDSLSYSWFFEGAYITGSSAHTPGTIGYETPGHYTTRLIVSGSSGSVEKSYRHVSIYDRPESGTNNPILLWEMDALSGSRDAGGYSATVRIRQSIPKTILRDNALVVVFADDWYGGTKQSIGGNALNRSNIVFVGYILAGTIRTDYATSHVEFEIVSPTGVMQDIEGFSVSIESKPAPATWYELVGMNVKRSLYHYLRWHSTALKCMDVEFRGTDQNIQYFDSDRESMFDAIYNLVQGALYGNVVCDRQGKLWAEVEVAATHLASGSFPTSMEWGNTNWMNEPSIDERLRPELSWIEMGGIAFDGTNYVPYLACAPGTAPGYIGGVERIQGLALDDQNQLNELVGDVFAARNARYPLIEFEGVGNYRNLDIAPQEFISVTINSTDTVRGISFAKKPFAVNFIQWSYNAGILMLLPIVSCAEVTAGTAGETIPIPEESPDDGFSQPPFPWPNFPIPASPAPVFLMTSGTAIELYDEGVYLGDITEIDFRGNPVLATYATNRGTVTFACSGTVTVGDAIGATLYATNYTISGSAEQRTAWSNYYYYNGVTLLGSTWYQGVQADINGFYTIIFTGYYSFYAADIESSTDKRFTPQIEVRRYNNSNVLQATQSGYGTDVYKYTVDGETKYAITGTLNLSAAMYANAGDYFTVFIRMAGAQSFTGTLNSTLSVVRT